MNTRARESMCNVRYISRATECIFIQRIDRFHSGYSYMRRLDAELLIPFRGQVPFLVGTAMVSGAVKANLIPMFVPTPESYAGAAVRWIGHGSLCVPYLAHALQWCVTSVVPEFALDSYRLREHLDQRAIFRRLRSWKN